MMFDAQSRVITGNAASVLIIFDDRIRESLDMSLSVCRDRGWSGVDASRLVHKIQANRVATRDRHKAPASTPLHPLALQDAGLRVVSYELQAMLFDEHHPPEMGTNADQGVAHEKNHFY